MVNSIKKLIVSICNSNLKQIRLEALKTLNVLKKYSLEDEYFCTECTKKIETDLNNSNNFPDTLRTIVYPENPSQISNYLISESEENLLEEIIKVEKIKNKIHICNTVLITGDSGTGKTFFGKYLSYKLNKDLYTVDLNLITDNHLLNDIIDYLKDKDGIILLDGLNRINIQSNFVVSIIKSFKMLDNNSIIIVTSSEKTFFDSFLKWIFIKTEFLGHTKEKKIEYAQKFLSNVGIQLSSRDISKVVDKSLNMFDLNKNLVEVLIKNENNKQRNISSI